MTLKLETKVETYFKTTYHLENTGKVDCTVYDSKEKAEANIEETCKRWGWNRNYTKVVAREEECWKIRHIYKKVK